jgi:hypothetical protein
MPANRSRFAPECVVVDAVQYEPVSQSKFPDNWENSGNFALFDPEIRISGSDRRAKSKPCSEIPCIQELGIFLKEQGSETIEDGKF